MKNYSKGKKTIRFIFHIITIHNNDDYGINRMNRSSINQSI